MLFSMAISTTKSLRIVYYLMILAVITSLSCCLIGKFAFSSEDFGFFNNEYKYGTYMGTLVPICGTFLFASSGVWKKMFGAVLVIGALISSGSLGAVAAIVVGIVVSAIIIPRWSVRILVIGCFMCVLGFLILLGTNPAVTQLLNDIKLSDKDNVNLKQRYIEWQAEINLLEERSISGTGAGCINEYRSNFYYRLPKLNTLQAFDLNGWLATSAETGILGLVFFSWIVLYYGKLALFQIARPKQKVSADKLSAFVKANFVGLIAACIANVFSSVHYNGVLIVFVLVLALIFRTNQLIGKP